MPDGLTLYADNYGEVIRFSIEAIDYVLNRKTFTASEKESGGQLFGLIDAFGARVVVATGPYSKDIRSPTRYRSNPGQAQASINRQSKEGLLYLGEWHTHFQDQPSPSKEDFIAMKALVKSSKLNTPHAILLIVGNGSFPDCFSIDSFGFENSAKWITAPFSQVLQRPE